METRDLQVNYGGRVAVTNVNTSVWKHDFTGVIGPNGGGKTTLMKAILGLVPYSGRVEYCKELEEDKSRIGYLPQQNNFDLSFPITVREVILSGLQSRKSYRKFTGVEVEKAEGLMTLTGINGLGERSVGEMSGGQLQRVLLCRAIISDPALLILDEPVTFVDSRFESNFYDILKKLNERMAILMVSHDVGTITSHVKSIICVNRTVHKHDTAELTPEMLENYDCPIQVISHGDIPHTTLKRH